MKKKRKRKNIFIYFLGQIANILRVQGLKIEIKVKGNKRKNKNKKDFF